MAASAEDVRNITGLPATVTDTQIAPFLAAALTMLNKISGCLTNKSITEESDLDQIQAWLAAHLISLSPVGKAAGLTVEEKFENWAVKKAQSSINNQFSGVMSTFYGQTANELSCGCLMEMGLRKPNIAFYG